MSKPRYCQRKDLGLLRVNGADARTFLHAQTTQEINDLPVAEARPAAWLSAKGRVRALFDVVPVDNTFWLVTQADTIDWLAQQLSRFVLRSDVKLEVVKNYAVYSLCGDIGHWLSDHGIDLEPRAVVSHDDALWIHEGSSCVHVVGKPDSLATTFADLATCERDTAVLAAIALGRPDLPATQRERYIPQMLNLERLGAVSFDKGCYPGRRSSHEPSIAALSNAGFTGFRSIGDRAPKPATISSIQRVYPQGRSTASQRAQTDLNCLPWFHRTLKPMCRRFRPTAADLSSCRSLTSLK